MAKHKPERSDIDGYEIPVVSISEWLWDEGRTVFSMPHTCFLGGEHAIIGGSPAVVQNISARCYTSWARGTVGSKYILDWCWPKHKMLTKDKKEEGEWGTPAKVSNSIKKVCDFFRLDRAFNIRVYTEGAPWGGANASGALCCGIAACILHANKMITESEIADTKGGLIPERLAEAFNGKDFLEKGTERIKKRKDFEDLPVESKFGAIMYLAFILECFSHNYKSSGYGAFCPLVCSRGPFVFFPQQRPDPG